MIKDEVKAREDAVAVKVGCEKIVVCERADVENQNVKGGVFLGKPRRKSGAPVFFVIKKRRVPLRDGRVVGGTRVRFGFKDRRSLIRYVRRSQFLPRPGEDDARREIKYREDRKPQPVP